MTLCRMSLNLKELKWERRKKAGYAPSIRSGCTMALWAAREIGILFGGVKDDDQSEETLVSEFYNDLCVPHTYNNICIFLFLCFHEDVAGEISFFRYGYHTAGNGKWTSMMIRKKKTPGQGRKQQPRAPAPTKQAEVQVRTSPSYFNVEANEDDNHEGASDTEITGQVQGHAVDEVQEAPSSSSNIDPDQPVLPLPRCKYTFASSIHGAYHRGPFFPLFWRRQCNARSIAEHTVHVCRPMSLISYVCPDWLTFAFSFALT
jgi:hypothetical protein